MTGQTRLPAALIVMVKAPLPGRVKTRLAATIGAEAALAAYRAMVATVLAAADASGLPTTIAFDPATPAGHDAVAALCGPARCFIPQAPGELGTRMADALARAFAGGATRAVLVGSDLPLLTAGRLRRAAAALNTPGTVLGPATDGGYWLIGCTRDNFFPDIFTDMPWSTSGVAALTLARLAAAGRPVKLLPTLPDCDVAADLARLARPPWQKCLAGTPFGRFLEEGPAGMFDQIPGCR